MFASFKVILAYIVSSIVLMLPRTRSHVWRVQRMRKDTCSFTGQWAEMSDLELFRGATFSSCFSTVQAFFFAHLPVNDLNSHVELLVDSLTLCHEFLMNKDYSKKIFNIDFLFEWLIALSSVVANIDQPIVMIMPSETQVSPPVIMVFIKIFVAVTTMKQCLANIHKVLFLLVCEQMWYQFCWDEMHAKFFS